MRADLSLCAWPRRMGRTGERRASASVGGAWQEPVPRRGSASFAVRFDLPRDANDRPAARGEPALRFDRHAVAHAETAHGAAGGRLSGLRVDRLPGAE